MLVMGLTGKTLSQQANLLRDSAIHFSNSISNSSNNFTDRLCNESEGHMLKKIVKPMAMEDDYSIGAWLWKIRKLKYAIGRFEEILQDEQRLRRDMKDKDNFSKYI
jgi:hypothetical protein